MDDVASDAANRLEKKENGRMKSIKHRVEFFILDNIVLYSSWRNASNMCR